MVTALLLAGSTALVLAQGTGGTASGAGPSGTAGAPSVSGTTGSSMPSGTGPTPKPDQATGAPSAVDTTGMGGSRPGCRPSTGSPSGSTADRPTEPATDGMRTPRIINDPTVGTSQSAETGLSINSMIPKDPKTGKARDC